MAVKLIKSNAKNAIDGYIPYWYGAYRDGDIVKTISLGIPVKGHPPASGIISDTGDAAFERSRREAEKEVARRADGTRERHARIRAAEKEKGDAIREYKEIIKIKTGRKFQDPDLDSLAEAYIEDIPDRSPCYYAMIRSGFKHFAEFAANPQAKVERRDIRPARTLLEVTPELAIAFFGYASKRYSFSTLKQWSTTFSVVFSKKAPVGMANPFKDARMTAIGKAKTRRDRKTGEKVKVETVVHHRPLDRDQLRKLYAAAKDDELLYPLTITAASTGLRISDVCTLLWKSVHLNDKDPETGDTIPPYIMVESTAKTGASVGVPIFDYDPKSVNYDRDLGEFRRILETALAESRDGEKYVFPKAARLYLKTKTDKNGEICFPGRDIIYAAGKRLFARALFADEPDDAELIESGKAGRAKPTTDDILAAIDSAEWTAERKKRIRDIYTRYSNGESYLDIVRATGYAKSTISSDLGTIEDLVGTKIKTYLSKRASVRDLLKRTRQERRHGRRGASIYSWHSLRASFVVAMSENGIDLDLIRSVVGHTTVEMTREYFNPTPKQNAERVRDMLLRRNRIQDTTNGARPLPLRETHFLPPPGSDTRADKLDALRAALASLTPAERKALLKTSK